MEHQDEQVAVAAVQDRLEKEFSNLDPAVVEAAVRLAHHELTGSPIRDFVPLLVEQTARKRLAFAHRQPSIEEALPMSPEEPPESLE